MSRITKIAENVTAHCFSPDKKFLAVCPNTEDVLIYSGVDNEDFTKWKLEHTLKGHDLVVSGIDWSPVHNKIVTCSHDRNAFVWTLKGGEWKPSLSILRINRAALAVKWSPDGKKFAVASGAKVVPVCHYEEQNDWWISKMIKKHKSTVINIAWHPNSQLLATASSDFRARVFSAFIPDVDGGGTDAILCGNTSKTAFGDLLAEFDGSGWVEGIAWSPNGCGLAFVAHDSSLTIANWDEKEKQKDPKVITFKEKSLPANHVVFLSDTVVVTAGHSLLPAVYQHPGAMRGDWKFIGFTEKEPEKKKTADKPKEEEKEKGFGDARSLWANKTTKGSDNATAADAAEIWTKHVNSITDIKPYGDTQWSTKVDAFSTCAMDGKVIVWMGRDLKNIVPGLAL